MEKVFIKIKIRNNEKSYKKEKFKRIKVNII